MLGKVSSTSLTPVIIISAKNTQNTKMDNLRSGADDFILKPFDVDDGS
ncbi:response regulator [Melghirimyces thermohalophilus]|nr:response regulator [Melghirimyces thermohalophilus]